MFEEFARPGRTRGGSRGGARSCSVSVMWFVLYGVNSVILRIPELVSCLVLSLVPDLSV